MAHKLANFHKAFNEEMNSVVILGVAFYDFAKHLKAKNETVPIFFLPADSGHYILDLADHVLDKLQVWGSLIIFDRKRVLVNVVLLLLDALGEFVFLNRIWVKKLRKSLLCLLLVKEFWQSSQGVVDKFNFAVA